MSSNFCTCTPKAYLFLRGCRLLSLLSDEQLRCRKSLQQASPSENVRPWPGRSPTALPVAFGSSASKTSLRSAVLAVSNFACRVTAQETPTVRNPSPVATRLQKAAPFRVLCQLGDLHDDTRESSLSLGGELGSRRGRGRLVEALGSSPRPGEPLRTRRRPRLRERCAVEASASASSTAAFPSSSPRGTGSAVSATPRRRNVVSHLQRQERH